MVDGMPVVRGGAEPGSHDPGTAADNVLASMSEHPHFPFYWTRTILKSPSWHLQMKQAMESKDSNVVWTSAPEFFELVRCWLEEQHDGDI